MGIIKAKQLVHEYIRRDEEGNVESIQTALDHVDLDVQQGDFIAILGHNGSGKSTLAKHINALLMPTEGWSEMGMTQSAAACDSLVEVLVLWFTSSIQVVVTILVVVTALMILHYILEEIHLMDGLSGFFAPLMRLFGLSRNCAFLWLVGNLVGLAYGGAIMVEQIQRGKVSYSEGNRLNCHLAVCHSLLEDTIIFVSIGIPFLWLVPTRLCFAILVVWAYRGYLRIYTRKIR